MAETKKDRPTEPSPLKRNPFQIKADMEIKALRARNRLNEQIRFDLEPIPESLTPLQERLWLLYRNS